MEIELLHGTVSDLSAWGKHGAAKCRLDGRNVMLPMDLTVNLHEGDNIQVAGTMKKDALLAMAMKNSRQGKTARVDATGYVMLMGLGGFLWILCGVLGLRAIGTDAVLMESINDLVSIAGFVVMLLMVRHVFLINKASDQIKYAEM